MLDLLPLFARIYLPIICFVGNKGFLGEMAKAEQAADNLHKAAGAEMVFMAGNNMKGQLCAKMGGIGIP
ncbi:hypothetical protein OG884_36295 [Streptosporangium sp. NBC_01755]|uniref:hypothetical protein n=1 Tax=Streptosporangium sp. NBC_01755 TaxID=2975949 RepID=UPI002DD87EA6|nr:hypothetical protein [Streptosporangium sp. NBC_01755]WSD00168.1 hypothetical protein OG884_36295 [Streptosporangium sp. NBC_01755]